LAEKIKTETKMFRFFSTYFLAQIEMKILFLEKDCNEKLEKAPNNLSIHAS